MWFEFARLLLPFLMEGFALAEDGFIVKVYGWFWKVMFAFLDSPSDVFDNLLLFRLICFLLFTKLVTVVIFFWLFDGVIEDVAIFSLTKWFREDTF